MNENSKFLLKQGEELFSKRQSLLTLWQDIAENFYPERADFTASRSLGFDFASNLMTSYPPMIRRDLGNSFGSMLRPTSKEWFHMRTMTPDDEDTEARAWLDDATARMRRVMYDKNSQFVRATKEGDHDFATFGQCAISVEMNRDATGLLYRCWHLRDMAWAEDEEGKISTIFRKWKPSARDLVTKFGSKVHPSVSEIVLKEPFKEINVWHCVIPADMYRGNQKIRTPFVSIYYDKDNQQEMECVGVYDTIYCIPRWQTVSGSQYAFSPASMIALPEARTLQAMALVLLEAGEKAVNPPMIARSNLFREDVSLYAGGVSWADINEGERIQDAYAILTNDKSGIPAGRDMQMHSQQILHDIFFLNALSLPPAGNGEMTAFETGQRVQEYIRQAMPLFEPMESDYNGNLCEMTFNRMQRAGAFGSPDNIPSALQGQTTQFVFESPLHDAIERAKGQRLIEAQQMIAQGMTVDPAVHYIMNTKKAIRDTLLSIGTPADWLNTESQVSQMEAQDQQSAQAQQMLAQLQQGADVAQKLGAANQTLQTA